MRKVYVLIGSEDGPMGTFSSHKRAVEAAIDYCLEGHFASTPPPNVNDSEHCTLVAGLSNTAEIRKDLILNHWHFRHII